MDSATRVFWALITVLLGASVFFGVAAQRHKAELRPEQGVSNGEVVSVMAVVDGDTVVIQTEVGTRVIVRLVGIKTFDAKQKSDGASRFTAAAVDALKRLTENEPVRVVLNATPRDRHGRTLAHLYAGEVDIGLDLVKKGLALTYPVYPFPSLSLYAEAQAHAHGDRVGLWGDPVLAARAKALERQWGREKR